MKAERTRTRWTYAEFARLPSEGGTRYEVIDDELYVTPSPSPRHQRIVTDLVVQLGAFVRSNHLGELFVSPLDVLFAEGDYMAPDTVFDPESRTVELWRFLQGADEPVVLRGVDQLRWEPVPAEPALAVPLEELFAV